MHFVLAETSGTMVAFLLMSLLILGGGALFAGTLLPRLPSRGSS